MHKISEGSVEPFSFAVLLFLGFFFQTGREENGKLYLGGEYVFSVPQLQW